MSQIFFHLNCLAVYVKIMFKAKKNKTQILVFKYISETSNNFYSLQYT